MSILPVLSRAVLRKLSSGAPENAALAEYPERAIQFGTGAFLRGFVDTLIHEANASGQFNGRVVTVSSTISGRDAALKAQDGLFTVVVQGVENGVASRVQQLVGSVSRSLSSRDDWQLVLECARDPRIEFVFSNTTEAGIVLDLDDTATPPETFPAKLTRFLHERARHFAYDAVHGVVVLPCELLDQNGSRLREIVVSLATHWKLDAQFIRWLDANVVFCNTLVDRIVAGSPSDIERKVIECEAGYRDNLITMCEPYRLFAIQGDDQLRERLGFANEANGVKVVEDLKPYVERKLRLLNGAHSSLVSIAMLAGAETVHDAMQDARLGRFVERVLHEDLVPVVDAPDSSAFADQVLDRFRNPFLRHTLRDIALQGTMKLRVRVIPSLVASVEQRGVVPPALTLGIAAHLELAGGNWRAEQLEAGASVPVDAHAEQLRSHWAGLDDSNGAVGAFVRRVCADVSLWGVDLTQLDGVQSAIGTHLLRIRREGATAALDAYLAHEASYS